MQRLYELLWERTGLVQVHGSKAGFRVQRASKSLQKHNTRNKRMTGVNEDFLKVSERVGGEERVAATRPW